MGRAGALSQSDNKAQKLPFRIPPKPLNPKPKALNPDPCTKDGDVWYKTPLIYAAETGQIQVLSLLLETWPLGFRVVGFGFRVYRL